MATTFTGLSEAQIDDVIIGAIQAMLPYFRAFSTQLDHPEGLVKGNSYIVPLIGALTVGDKTPGTLATASGSVTGVSVEADKFKAAAFEAIEGTISARLLATWWPEQIREAAKSVAAQCVDGALNLVTAANFGSTEGEDVITQALSGMDVGTLADLRTAAKNKLKGIPGAFLCNAAVGSKLITLEQMVYALAIADNRNSIADGRIPGGVLGYDAYEYVDLPSNSENLVAAVIGRSALAVVAGAPEQIITSGQGNVAYRRIVEEPESGLSLQYTEVVDGGGKITAELGLLYGAKKGQDAAVRLVTA